MSVRRAISDPGALHVSPHAGERARRRPWPRQAARRPLCAPQPAPGRDGPELLLRHGRSLRQRRHRERQRRAAAREGRRAVRLRPHGEGLVPRRRPEGPHGQDRLHQGARHDRALAHAELQEQGRPARGQLRRLPRLLDHRLHADRPAPGHQPGPADAGQRGPLARDQGLLRHHHQPHGRRDQVRAAENGTPSGCRTPRRTSRRTAARTRAQRSTTATSPPATTSRRCRRPASRRARCCPRSSAASPTTRASRPPSRTSRCRPGSTT